MKKIFELVKSLTAVLFLCIAGVLLSGCTAQMAMGMKYDLNPKTREVNRSWIDRFAKLNQTKDIDILHKLCKPTLIFQYSNGEKNYVYWVLKDEHGDSNSVAFQFNPNRTLKKIWFNERYESNVKSAYRNVKSEKDLLALLETLPSNPTQQILKKVLGKPHFSVGNTMTYTYVKPVSHFLQIAYRTENDRREISFKIKSNGKVEYMTVPKTFYEFAKKKHARFNFKTIYVSERKINEEEAAVIEKCEK